MGWLLSPRELAQQLGDHLITSIGGVLVARGRGRRSARTRTRGDWLRSAPRYRSTSPRVIWRAPVLNTSRASSSVASITRTAQTVGRLWHDCRQVDPGVSNRRQQSVRAHTVPTIYPQLQVSRLIQRDVFSQAGGFSA